MGEKRAFPNIARRFGKCTIWRLNSQVTRVGNLKRTIETQTMAPHANFQCGDRSMRTSSFASAIPRPMLCGLFLRSSDEDAGNEDECSAKPHLQSCGEHGRIHEPVPHPRDDPEFDKDDGDCNAKGYAKLGDKERV